MLDFSIEPKITKDYILSNINQETILNYYLKLPVESKKLFISPFRDDKRPTCGFYKSKSGIVYFHDFATNKHYNCFGVVMELFGCPYYKALKIIAKDFNLVSGEVTAKIKPIQCKELDTKKETQIQVKIKDFSESELLWWSKYGITLDILKKFNVYSCDTVFLNGSLYCSSTTKCPIYGYYNGKQNNIELWRIYFPTRKSYRFLGNLSAKKIQGFRQLPNSGKLLVITKSQKDVMCYYSLGVTAIAPNSETIFIEEKVLNNLKTRFKYIIVHYDNDRAGKYNMALIRHKYPELFYFFIPNSYKAKDISDFYKKYGRSKTIKFLNQNILKLKR